MMLRPEQWFTQTNGDDFYREEHQGPRRRMDRVPLRLEPRRRLTSPTSASARRCPRPTTTTRCSNTICYGLYQPCQGPFHPTNWAFPKNPPEPYQQDLDKAEDLLDEAGWTDSDGDGIRDKEINGRIVPFEFTLNTYQTETAHPGVDAC